MAERTTCGLCGKEVAIRGGWPDRYLHPHADPETGVRCDASNYYLDEDEA